MDRKSGQKTRDAILDMIAQDAKVTSTQMAEALSTNRSAVSKHLKKMQEDGIIKREGPDKGGKWVVIKNDTMMDKDFERLIKYRRKEDVALFIGSGFSFKAGAPHVCNIIEDILKEGGEQFTLENKDKKLREVSESFVDFCDGRNDLISLLGRLFNFDVKDTSDQDSLRKIPHFKTIFTTNYDTLLENAYPQSERVVITSNAGSSYVDDKKVNIYKMHGDITTLNAPDGIIITESDYQNYFKTGKYELIWETLKIVFQRSICCLSAIVLKMTTLLI